LYKEALDKALGAMLEGEDLSGPIAETGLFPNAVIQIMRVGETTGRLDVQLDSAAKYYAQELDFRVKRFTTLFEPGVMIFMGVIVGFVAVALVQAMYGVYHQTGIK
jgi:type IV pilus assembly protein PilC